MLEAARGRGYRSARLLLLLQFEPMKEFPSSLTLGLAVVSSCLWYRYSIPLEEIPHSFKGYSSKLVGTSLAPFKQNPCGSRSP